MLKKNPVQVLLDDLDDRDVEKLVKLEAKERRDATLGKGTLLREHAMPSIRARLAELSGEPAGTR